ncbi:hypothetical protein A9762_27480 [Pandoraea sp. ISTKB]|nr:hypothetical protein A9762_27480 [Pandoraea sp. ISTKB]
MKVKCIRLLDAFGREVEFSPWLKLGRTYCVMSIEIDPLGRRSYGIITSAREGEWPSMGGHQAECFDVVSTMVPSNWRQKIHENGSISIAPGAWLQTGFLDAFYDREPAAYLIFERERDLILSEDP